MSIGRLCTATHGNIDGGSKRQRLNAALAGNLIVVRMDTADGKSPLTHLSCPPLLSDYEP